MESGIPDFKDWHELKDKTEKILLPGGKSFFKLLFYIKYESVDKVFEGIRAFLYDKEIFKAWTGPDSSGKKNQKIMALLLEDGSWVTSLPIYKGQDAYNYFNMTEDFENHIFKINILTESGWKSRALKVK